MNFPKKFTLFSIKTQILKKENCIRTDAENVLKQQVDTLDRILFCEPAVEIIIL